MAGARIGEDAVLHTVELVAAGDNSAVDEGDVSCRNVAGFIREQGLHPNGGAGQQRGPVVGGRAGHDAVVVCGKALGFHQGLAAAVGATGEVIVRSRCAVVGGQNRFGLQRHLVNAAPAEISNLFRMMKSPSRIDAVGEMAGVGARGGVTVCEKTGEGLVVDLACKAAIALTLKAMVPVCACKRQPHFDLDVGVRGGRGLNLDAAEGRQMLIECNLLVRAGGTRRRHKCAGGDDLRGDDVRVVKLKRLEAGAAALRRLGEA